MFAKYILCWVRNLYVHTRDHISSPVLLKLNQNVLTDDFLVHFQIWVMWVQKLSHQFTSNENLVYTLDATNLAKSSVKSISLFILVVLNLLLNMGHVGPKPRSPDHFKGNPVYTIFSKLNQKS